jgi:hypothetical protein
MTKNPFNDIAEEYDARFEETPVLYRSELETLQLFILTKGKGLDIGTGRFADELGIITGIDPAPNVAGVARKKDIEFCQTLSNPEPEQVEQPKPGYGKGSFIVIKATKHNE